MKIIFIKSYMMNGIKQVVGQKATVRTSKLIDLGVAREYHGNNSKTKIKLSNLK